MSDEYNAETCIMLNCRPTKFAALDEDWVRMGCSCPTLAALLLQWVHSEQMTLKDVAKDYAKRRFVNVESLLRVELEQGRRFVPGLLRQQVQRWALRAGIRRPNGRTCTGSPEALKIAQSAKNRDHAAQILGVTRQTICNWKKNATLRRQTRPVAQCVDSSDTTQMTDRLLHPKPDRLRLQVKASKRTMSDLAHDLCVSDSHLHHLIRTGAWTPQHLRNLRRSLGPEAWEFVSGQTKRIAV